jgi:hypothetical protein
MRPQHSAKEQDPIHGRRNETQDAPVGQRAMPPQTFRALLGVVTEAIRLNPRAWEAYHGRGLARAFWPDRPGAISGFQEAAVGHPDSGSPWVARPHLKHDRFFAREVNPMDPYRPPRHLVPTRYDIRLEPDLTANSFEGDEARRDNRVAHDWCVREPSIRI